MKTDADLEALIATLTEHYARLRTEPEPGKRLHGKAIDIAIAFERWLHNIDVKDGATVDDVINVSVSVCVSMLSRILDPVLANDPDLDRYDLVDKIVEVIHVVLTDPASLHPDDGSITTITTKAN